MLCSALRDALLRAIVFRAVGYVHGGDVDFEDKFAELVVLLAA